MKRMGLCLSAVASLVLSGCFAAPQMRMDAPENDSEMNGIKVYVHSIEDGDFSEQGQTADSAVTYGDLNDLIVDSLPNLEYRIGPLDMVQVVVWEHPELTSPMGQYQPAGQKVTTEGKLFYPYAGEIMAAGLTAQELRQEITRRLSDKILNDPQVDVRVTGYNSLKAFISGSVKNPGFIRLDENPMTIPMALAEAGGFEDDADLSMVQLRRGDKLYRIDYQNVFESNLPLDRILLKPSDKIYVASKSETERENRVYVMGEVQKVGFAYMDDKKLSLVEALTSAGGLQTLNASSRSIYVIRNTSEKQIDVFHLDAKNAMALAMAERFSMKARDIVYVDASGVATWNRLLSLIWSTEQTIYYGGKTVESVISIHNSKWE